MAGQPAGVLDHTPEAVGFGAWVRTIEGWSIDMVVLVVAATLLWSCVSSCASCLGSIVSIIFDVATCGPLRRLLFTADTSSREDGQHKVRRSLSREGLKAE